MKIESHAMHSPWLGAIWKITAFACYAVLNGIGKYLCGGTESAAIPQLPINTVVFVQDFLALVILLPWLMPKQKNKIQNKTIHVLRGVFSALAIVTWYQALTYMPIAEAVALSIVGPVMGVLGANLFLGEKIEGTRLYAIFISLILACFVIHPGSAFLQNKANLIGLGCVVSSSLFFAIAKILTRKLAHLGNSPKQLTYSLLMCVVPITLILALTNWQTPQSAHILWLLLGGILTAGAIFCVSSSLYYAEVSFLAPFDLFRFTLNAMVGYIAFMETPSIEAILMVGVLFIMMSAKGVFQKN
jgi:drug/metabolite transporter (DMT)-like permease